MPNYNVRAIVTKALKPLLPKKWVVKDHNDLPDEIIAPTVVLSFQSYSRTSVSPRAARTATFILTILTPKTIPGEADDALDEIVIDLLNAIDKKADIGLLWTTAERGVASGRPGFDITLSLAFTLDPPTQENP